MSIYPDKKNGKLTGRFRVEVQGRYARYRARCDSIGEAVRKDAEFKALAADGVPPPPPSTKVGGRPKAGGGLQWPAGTPEGFIQAVMSLGGGAAPQPSERLSWCVQEAKGRLWANPRTAQNNEGHLSIILEAVGDCDLNSIDDTWVLDLKETLKDTRKGKTGEPLSDGTINRYLASLSTFLKYAVDKKWRTVRDMPKMEYAAEAEGRIRWYTEEEEAVMLPLLAERSRKLVRFAILTGGRRGELMRLEPRDVFSDRIILWGDDTKSGKSRPIPLTDEGLALAKWLVTDGNMPSETMLRDDWDAMRATNPEWAADPEFVFHGCRHTFATRAVEKSVDIRTLQKWLGHETIEMTERYAKVSGKALMNARDMMFGGAIAA